LNEMGEHLPFWQRDLDLMVLTHPHQDHTMGLIDVLERYEVDQVVQTEFTATSSLVGQWLHAVKTAGVPIHYPRRGESITFEGEPEVELRILNPLTTESAGGKQGDDINNGSVVLRLSYGKHDILLEGDAQEAAEAEMSRLPGEEIASEILKVGHHGSDTSSTQQFVEQVRPQVAIISVGTENKYGHPASETLQTIQEAGAIIYRTDLNGTVEIIADKERMWVRSER
ncbi:MAG: MBL fold metallo-hydrolase, partial [Chloroflexia bacterium]